MITVAGTPVHLLSYPLWAVWHTATETCSGVTNGSGRISQVVGFTDLGSYCLQSDTGALFIFDDDALFVVGQLETFDSRDAAVSHLDLLHGVEDELNRKHCCHAR